MREPRRATVDRLDLLNEAAKCTGTGRNVALLVRTIPPRHRGRCMQALIDQGWRHVAPRPPKHLMTVCLKYMVTL